MSSLDTIDTMQRLRALLPMAARIFGRRDPVTVLMRRAVASGRDRHVRAAWAAWVESRPCEDAPERIVVPSADLPRYLSTREDWEWWRAATVSHEHGLCDLDAVAVTVERSGGGWVRVAANAWRTLPGASLRLQAALDAYTR